MSLLQGWPGLLAGYATVQAPLIVALARARAPLRQFLLSPLLAAPLTVLAGAALSAAAPLARTLGASGAAALELAGGVALSASLGYGAGRALVRRARPAVIHQRGALVAAADGGTAPRTVRHDRTHRPSAHQAGRQVTLAGVPVAAADEVKHFKLIGTTGTGKSTAIQELLSAALGRGDRAVIADPDGGYLRRFYDAGRGDVILNPFERAPRDGISSPKSAMTTTSSSSPARSFPITRVADRSWRGYARTFFSAVTAQAHAAGSRDVRELYRLLVVAGTAELRTLVAGTPAQPFLEEHNGRMFDSIRSVTSSAVGALEYVARHAQRAALGARLGAQRGRRARTARGVPVPALSGRTDCGAALDDLRVDATRDLRGDEPRGGASSDYGLWSMSSMRSGRSTASRMRSRGCANSAAAASSGFSRSRRSPSTYGTGEAQTLVENCGNTLILRCSGSEHGGTSQFASRLIGEREVLRTRLPRVAPGSGAARR